MANEEKLIADAFLQAFKKAAKIPPDLYLRMSQELKIDDSEEPLKVNLTMKGGLVLDIEDDSLFRTFLTIGDIVLTINDKVASSPDFKLTDVFKGAKTISITYIRLRNYSMEDPRLEEGERRENYDYKVAIIYGLQRMHLGMAMEGLNNRVFLTAIQPKSLGSLCAEVGDIILHVTGKRVMDTEKTMALISDELEQKSYCKITLERAKSEEAKAQVQFAVAKENRDPPIPADCAAYIEKALAAMKLPEPKSIMRTPSITVPVGGVSVGFHDRMTTDSVIPSDVPDESLVKTPPRVPNAAAAATSPASQALSARLPVSPQIERAESSVMKNVSAVLEVDSKKQPSNPRNRKGSATKTAGSPKEPQQQGKSKERRRFSTEIFFGRLNRKKSAGSGGSAEATKHKKKKGKKDRSTTNDAEGQTP